MPDAIRLHVLAAWSNKDSNKEHKGLVSSTLLRIKHGMPLLSTDKLPRWAAQRAPPGMPGSLCSNVASPQEECISAESYHMGQVHVLTSACDTWTPDLLKLLLGCSDDLNLGGRGWGGCS
jgi:hypothetical protein